MTEPRQPLGLAGEEFPVCLGARLDLRFQARVQGPVQRAVTQAL